MTDPKDSTVTPQTVVGIAASAGGLEAMTVLAQNLPEELDCAYILAQHLSPKHDSLLSILLARETKLRVTEVAESRKIEPRTIYVPIPGHDLIVQDGNVSPVRPKGHPTEPKPLADRLFASLAAECAESAVAIVMSGTGSDGSYGVQDVREAGGITVAQDPASCKYDSMPVSAIETGCVDLVLTPRQIAEHLKTILAQPRDLAPLQKVVETPPQYNDLFQVLMARTGVDFRDYKESTVNRRIQRRMIAMGKTTYDEYVNLCRTAPDEIDALFRDLLISVTRFFRDPDQFKVLAEAIEALVRDRQDQPLRLWVPGCATGEEVYSIAILLCEALGGIEAFNANKIQILATDIDLQALARARRGEYPIAALGDIPKAFAEPYFTVRNETIIVAPEIRRLIMFSEHNIIQDPPFANIDLVSFRNALIYFNTSLQDRVLTRLNYALRNSGLLFLGTSEYLGALDMYFDAVRPNFKVFRKRKHTPFTGLPRASERNGNVSLRRIERGREAEEKSLSDQGLRMFEALATAVAPNGFLTNKRKEILRIFGDLTEFTTITDSVRGKLSTDMLRPQLAHEVSSLIPLSLKHSTARSGKWHDIEGRGFNQVRVTTYPIRDDGDTEAVLLVAFATRSQAKPPVPEATSADDRSYTAHLEKELADSREALQFTMEELQTSNEELHSINEELQSSNEELQSTNEELETANEELQSTNEELITVNEELLVNADELNSVAADRAGILTALPIPVFTIDQGFVIRNASKGAQHLFHLSDTGGHFGHLSQMALPEGFPRIVELCAEAFKTRKDNRLAFAIGGTRYEFVISNYLKSADELAGLTLVLQSQPLSEGEDLTLETGTPLA